jgi:phosphopantothenoylcysteine decarboxylase / phosphopantothenate---cysteine ligase
MKVLITAGPTYEYIDLVRYISNASSGKMGYELARAARDYGHEVMLVSGPTSLKAPIGVKLVKVISAREMYEVTAKLFNYADAVIMSAAVSDYRPAYYFNGKMKKQNKNLTLNLVPTVDILKTLGKKKKNRVLVGFALEVKEGRENAVKKLYQKNLDYVVLNSPDAFSQDNSTVEIRDKKGLVKRFTNTSKRLISRFIIRLIKVDK